MPYKCQPHSQAILTILQYGESNQNLEVLKAWERGYQVAEDVQLTFCKPSLTPSPSVYMSGNETVKPRHTAII